MVMTGSGPSYGTALVQQRPSWPRQPASSPSGQNLEEWSHVERWAYPEDIPVFVIAPPGRSHWRAVTLAAMAQGSGTPGRRGDHPSDNDEITRHAGFVLPVLGEVREEFSPLVYHVFACYLASYSATQLGRWPFQARP